jgi:hypothetical protein
MKGAVADEMLGPRCRFVSGQVRDVVSGQVISGDEDRSLGQPLAPHGPNKEATHRR